MRTRLKLGPADHGRRVGFDDFVSADFDLGHEYELIHGRIQVSPLPDPPADRLEIWLLRLLMDYARARPDVTNHVTNKARIYVGGRDDVSYPEPDIAAYHDYPSSQQSPRKWREINPVLVVEILDPDNPEKDTARNVEVYLEVPSVKEYWIVDMRAGEATPTLLVYRRHGKRWRSVIEVPFSETYSTKLLPGFELIVDPNAEQPEV